MVPIKDVQIVAHFLGESSVLENNFSRLPSSKDFFLSKYFIQDTTVHPEDCYHYVFHQPLVYHCVCGCASTKD